MSSRVLPRVLCRRLLRLFLPFTELLILTLPSNDILCLVDWGSWLDVEDVPNVIGEFLYSSRDGTTLWDDIGTGLRPVLLLFKGLVADTKDAVQATPEGFSDPFLLQSPHYLNFKHFLRLVK